jgi:hypothetical protein
MQHQSKEFPIVMVEDRIRFSTTPLKVAGYLGSSLAVLAFLSELFVGKGQYALIAIGILSLIAAALPLLVKRRFEPFEPIVLFAFSVFMGCTLRAIMLSFSDPNDYKIIFLTDGMPLADIVTNGVWIPVSLAIFSIGYIFTSKRIAIEQLAVIRRERWSNSRLFLLVGILTFVSLVAVLKLSQATGVDFSNLEKLSVKRTVQVDAMGEDRYAKLGYLRWAADLARLALFMLFTSWAVRRKNVARTPPITRLLYMVPIVILVFVSMAWPVISSSRTGILETIFGLLVLSTYLGFRGEASARKRKFLRFSTIVAAIAVAVLVSVGVWRQYSQVGAVLDTSLEQAILNNTVGSGNFLPLERTALIIDQMPKRGDWLLGKSYFSVFFAPIPRSIWHEKPEIGLGLFIKRELYGRRTAANGYPPGLLGEAFINFGFPGLIAIPLLAGALLKLFLNSFKPLLGKNKNATILYALVLWPVSFQLADIDFPIMIINVLTASISGFLFLWFVSPQKGLSN